MTQWTARRLTNSPTISIDASTAIAAEGSSFTVTANANFPWAVDRTLTFSSTGSAQLGSDFTLVPTQLTIPADSQRGAITINVAMDGVPDGNETIALDVANVSNGEVSTGIPSVAIVEAGGGGSGFLVVRTPELTDPPQPGLPSGTLYDFGETILGDSILLHLIVTNEGNGDLRGEKPLIVAGADSEAFEIKDTLLARLQPSQKDYVDIQFRPQDVGAHEATMVISYDDEPPFLLNLLGIGIGPDIAVTPGSYDFGEVNVVDGMATTTFTVSNTGTGDLNISTPLPPLGGSHPEDFRVVRQPASVVTPGGSTELEIAFDPSVLGDRDASVAIVNNDINGSPFVVTFSGIGVTPEIEASSLSHYFGEVGIDGDLEATTFIISNSGSADLNIITPLPPLGGSHPEDFRIVRQPASVVPPGGSTELEIIFDPSAVGNRDASVAIVNNDRNGSPFVLTFSGVGVLSPQIEVSSLSHNFGEVGIDGGLEKTTTFIISNSGSADLNIITPLPPLGGSHPEDFRVVRQPASVVPPGGSTELEIAFDPSAVGNRDASVAIVNNDRNGSPFVLTFSGIGVLSSADFDDDQDVDGLDFLQWQRSFQANASGDADGDGDTDKDDLLVCEQQFGPYVSGPEFLVNATETGSVNEPDIISTAVYADLSKLGLLQSGKDKGEILSGVSALYLDNGVLSQLPTKPSSARSGSVSRNSNAPRDSLFDRPPSYLDGRLGQNHNEISSVRLDAKNAADEVFGDAGTGGLVAWLDELFHPQV